MLVKFTDPIPITNPYPALYLFSIFLVIKISITSFTHLSDFPDWSVLFFCMSEIIFLRPQSWPFLRLLFFIKDTINSDSLLKSIISGLSSRIQLSHLLHLGMLITSFSFANLPVSK